MTVLFRCDTCESVFEQGDILSDDVPFRYEHHDHTRGLSINVAYADPSKQHQCRGCMKKDIMEMLAVLWGDEFATKIPNLESPSTDSDVREMQSEDAVQLSSTLVPTKCKCDWREGGVATGFGSHIEKYYADCPIHGIR